MTDENEPSSFDAAISKARTELGALYREASEADTVSDDINSNFTLHEVDGVGRYAIADDDGWYLLAALIENPETALGFSRGNYPVFDALVEDRCSTLTPEIKANLAAVRNFLLQRYFAETPEGMNLEKAILSLSQTAMYTGNALARGAQPMPVDASRVAIIDLPQAGAEHGQGARYLYQKILEAQRQSNWLRPFSPITSLFGGKELIDWKLPSLQDSPFREEEPPPMKDLARDLESLSDHLLSTAARLQDVQNLSEPVRQDAIAIAREILRKLKVKIGDMPVLNGLNFETEENTDELGGLAGVAMIFELLLAWGRGIDAAIAQHPTVQAAIRAIGQLGYIAKMESLRLATQSNQSGMIERLQAQLKRMPKNYTLAPQTKHGELLDRVERGIDTVLNRVVEINGPNALVGHTAAKQLGAYMSATPIAGLAMLGSSTGASRDGAGKENATVMQAIEMAERAQAARMQSQIAGQAQRGQQVQITGRSAGGRQAMAQARANQARQGSQSTSNTFSGIPPGTQNQMAQRALMIRNAALRALYGHHEEDDHQHDNTHNVVARLDPRILQSVRAAAMKGGISGGTTAQFGGQGGLSSGLKPTQTPNVKQQNQQQAATKDTKDPKDKADNKAKPSSTDGDEEKLRQLQGQQPNKPNPGRGI